MEYTIEIFCCYALEDRKLLIELQKHLATLQRQRLANIWSDINIDAGVVRESAIDAHLDTAQIILLLLSADFISSDDHYNNQMKRAMQRHERGEAQVIPVILRPFNWKIPHLGELQALPFNGLPVDSWSKIDDPLTEITLHIQKLVNDLHVEHSLREAQKLQEAQDYRAALALYEQILQFAPDSAPSYRGKGDTLFHLERYEECLAAYAAFKRRDPEGVDERLAIRLARSFMLTGQHEESLATYDEALRLTSDAKAKAHIYRQKAHILLDLQRADEAQACYNRARRLESEGTDRAGGVLLPVSSTLLETPFPTANLKSQGNGRVGGVLLPVSRTLPKTPFPTANLESQVNGRVEEKLPLATGNPDEPSLGSLPQPQPGRRKIRPWMIVVIFLLLAALIAAPFIIIGYQSRNMVSLPALLPGSANGIEAYKVGDETIGISDGRFELETVGPHEVNQHALDSSVLNNKKQAARFFQEYLEGKPSSSEALGEWDAALDGDNSNDAEALIYRENLRVLISGNHYITFVVGTSFTTDDALSIPILRGAFILQHECNTKPQSCGGMNIRLLIANSGSTDSTKIANMIVNAAQANGIVGVLGWTSTDTTLNALKILRQAKIPMIGSNTSGDSLTGISPYFFRVMPSNSAQASVAAQYVQKELDLHRPLIIEDDSYDFSRSLTNDLKAHFPKSPLQIQLAKIGSYGAADAQKTLDLLNSYHPDVIFFTSYKITDMTRFLEMVSAYAGSNLNPRVVLGSGYQLVEALGHLDPRILYATGGFADMWDSLAPQGTARPDFFCDYARAFDPQKLHQGPESCGYPPTAQQQGMESPYTYTRPTSYDMLGYDAMKALITGMIFALDHKQGGKITPDDVRTGIAHITGTQAIQGVTGEISFGKNGDSQNRSVVVLSAINHGYLQMDAYQGCFLVHMCENSSP